MKRRRIAIAVAVLAALAALAVWWRIGRDGDAGRGARGAAKDASQAARLRAARARAAPPDPHSLARASIAGTVRDPTGAPIAAAQVCGSASSPDLAEEDTRTPVCAHSQADGRYRLENLLPARYEVDASAERSMPGTYRDPADRDGDGFRLRAGEARTGIDIVLEPGGVEIRGTVVDIGGGPIADAWVYARARRNWSTRGGRSVARSAADGTFVVWVPAGEVSLSADADGYAAGWKVAVAPTAKVEILLTPESVLAGVVVEHGSGKPVAGARVSPGSDSDWAGDAITGNDGRFRITRLHPGRYKPSAEAAGLSGHARSSVLLGLAQTVDDVVIEVHAAAVVTGRIVVDEETPCRHGWVELTEKERGEEASGSVLEEDGVVAIKAVFPGTYRVQVRCRDFVGEDTYPDLVVAAGADPPEQTWRVRGGARIHGTVRTADGSPVTGAEVRARPSGGERTATPTWGSEDVAADGTYEIAGLRAGTYQVRAELPGYLEHEGEVVLADNGDATVDVTLDKGGQVAGEVVDDRGAPVADVMVGASGLVAARSRASTRTREDGSFTLDGLHPGPHRVLATSAPGSRRALRTPGQRDDDVLGERVEVVAGQVARVRLVVETHAGRIRGRVVDATGAPTADAWLDAERESDSAADQAGSARRSMRGWSRRPVLTDTDGRFEIPDLAPGKYTVRAFRKGGGETIQEGVAVGSTVTLTIRPTASISGTVRSASGAAPAERFTVEIQNQRLGFSREESFFRTGGVFAMNDLPAGSFQLTAEAPEGTGSLHVEIADGQAKTGVVVELTGRATVTGRVVALDDGKPLRGFRMGVRQAGGGGGFDYSTGETERITDAAGRFTVKNAPAGRVQVYGMPADRGGAYGVFAVVATAEAGKTTDVGDLRVPAARAKRNDPRGDLGYTLKEQPPDADPEAIVWQVAVVRAGGPAERAGLKVADVITSVDGHDVTGAQNYLYPALARVQPGMVVELGVARGAKVRITAGEPP